jgi:drug/metabolite transporter (DMT)-like permease
LPGEAKALLAAFIWALTIIVLTSQTRRIGAISLNVVRGIFGGLFLLAILPFTSAGGELHDMSAATAVAMVGSGILIFCIGDSLYFLSLPALGASIAVPLAESSYPLITFLIAWLWLGEALSPVFLIGSCFVVIGIIFLSGEARHPPLIDGLDGTDSDPVPGLRPRWRVGIPLVAGVAITWAIGTVWFKAGSGNLGPLSASVLRITPAVILLAPLAHRLPHGLELRSYSRADFIGAAFTGIFGVGVAGLLHVAAIQEIGASRTSILTATIPLFTLPLAVVFLHERVTPRVVLGTVACVIGLWFIV